MSINGIQGAHAVREHLKGENFTAAIACIRTLNVSNEERRQVCALVLLALQKARRGPARDNGFSALIGLLAELGDAKQAFVVVESIGTDSHLFSKIAEIKASIEELATKQEQALREQVRA